MDLLSPRLVGVVGAISQSSHFCIASSAYLSGNHVTQFPDVTLWLYDSVTLWLCDSVTLWLCDSVTLWLCDSVWFGAGHLAQHFEFYGSAKNNSSIECQIRHDGSVGEWMNLTVCPICDLGPGHDSSVGERTYLTVVLPCGPGSTPSCGRIFQEILPWLITLCQLVWGQRGMQKMATSPLNDTTQLVKVESKGQSSITDRQWLKKKNDRVSSVD